MSEERTIGLTLHLREDGGLRVTSDDVLGLILSHADPVLVCADIWPAISTILDLPHSPIVHECICRDCGIRHGGMKSIDAGF